MFERQIFGSRKNIVCRYLSKAGVTAFLAGLSLCIHTPHSKSTLLGPIDLGGRPFLAAILQPEKKCPGKLHRSAKARQGCSSRWHDSSNDYYCRIKHSSSGYVFAARTFQLQNRRPPTAFISSVNNQWNLLELGRLWCRQITLPARKKVFLVKAI